MEDIYLQQLQEAQQVQGRCINGLARNQELMVKNMEKLNSRMEKVEGNVATIMKVWENFKRTVAYLQEENGRSYLHEGNERPEGGLAFYNSYNNGVHDHGNTRDEDEELSQPRKRNDNDNGSHDHRRENDREDNEKGQCSKAVKMSFLNSMAKIIGGGFGMPQLLQTSPNCRGGESRTCTHAF